MQNEKLNKQSSPKKFLGLLLVSGALARLVTPTIANAASNDCNNPSPAGLQKCLEGNPIVNDIQIVVNFLAAGVGIVVVGVIVVGGIQYMTAGDNPQALTAAKQRITNGLIALAAFLFTFAFLNWLIPGGIFK